MERFIKELGKEMKSQDNLATAHPLYCVYEKELIYGLSSSYAEEYEEIDGKKVYYTERERFINAHLTMRAANLFITQNKHNLRKPYVYVHSLYRCHEMIKLQEWLKKQAE